MSAHIIPPMTDPLGRHWNQPPLEQVLVDDTHALMTPATFAQLSEYSSTLPSGVYEGKMWRRHDGAHDPRRTRPPIWLLCWYGSHPDPGNCSINSRVVLLA